MALQVAKRAVVGEDVETIARPLERAAGLVAAIGAVADRRGQHRFALELAHASGDVHQLGVGAVRRGVQRGGDDLHFSVGIEIRQRDFIGRHRGDVRLDPSRAT